MTWGKGNLMSGDIRIMSYDQTLIMLIVYWLCLPFTIILSQLLVVFNLPVFYVLSVYDFISYLFI